MKWQGLLRFLVIGVGVLAFSILVQSEISFLTGLAQAQDYKAWIEIEADNSHLRIKAFCFNNTPKDSVVRYQLKTEKIGKNGKTFISQSGSVFVPAQEEKLLSQLGLRVSPDDTYRLKLEVYKEERLVAKDSIIYSQGLGI